MKIKQQALVPNVDRSEEDLDLMRIEILKLLIVYVKSKTSLLFLLFKDEYQDDYYYKNKNRIFKWLNNFKVDVQGRKESLNTILNNNWLELNVKFIVNSLVESLGGGVDILTTLEKSQFVQLMTINKELPTIIKYLNELKDGQPIPKEILIYLDKCGFIWGKTKTYHEYISFIIKQIRLVLKCESYRKIYLKGKNEFIPVEHFQNAEVTQPLKEKFGIQNCLWIPGIYESNSLPLTSGGISISVKGFGVFIQLHSLLKDKQIYYSLDRNELILHEIIHACRECVGSEMFEEEFAYSLSPSRLRKLLSPITRGSSESLLFYLISIISITSDLPSFPRWFARVSKIPFIILTLIGLFRLMRSKQYLNGAFNYLTVKQNISPSTASCILFRLTDDEILMLFNLFKQNSNTGIREIVSRKLEQGIDINQRWSVIVDRFLPSFQNVSKL
ncbi:predicted protein [Naegleria gruberi]|uniref:Predicted protein n=1 Tax=Naegleria gruberi TaxID=5762 RepID=D2VCZ7_NAEGR|nr:uncharacterized protein NAEGRDRAFT_66744 [Naegleria gruberi]EFC45508.1 predicted protein [Naegleria gruberi]|eukprot:XP_002678252.1 predicted protein [Naegleria gruberi strain NEG-M]